MASERDLTYSESCRCARFMCRCRFFCRPVDKGLCLYCREGHHGLNPHNIQLDADSLNVRCVACEMPPEYENTFPFCPGITERELEARPWAEVY